MAMPIGGLTPTHEQINLEAQRNPYTSEGFLLEVADIADPQAQLADVIALPRTVEQIEDLHVIETELIVPTHVHPTQIAVIGGAKVKFTVEEPTMAEDLKYEAAILLSHGILGEEIIYEDFRHALSQLGWRVISYEPARSVGVRGYHPAHVLHPEKLLSQAAYGVMITSQENFKIKSFINVVHSMGGLTAKALNDFLGDKAPEFIDAQVYVDAVGFNKEPLIKRAGRFIAMVATQAPGFALSQPPKRAARIMAHEARYIARNPKRFVGELLTAQRCQNAETVLRARNLGIRTACIAMTKSVIFPPYDVARQSDDLFNIFDIYEGDHLVQSKDPNNFARFVDELLNELLGPFAEV